MANSKNRFSQILDQMLKITDIKQYVLADELNYDTSYISKWLNGHMIPSEKNIDEVLRGISKCIAKNGTESGIAELAKGYQLVSIDELERAICDQLTAEYNYVSKINTSALEGDVPELEMYPEMSVVKFLRRLKHPILRRISNLHIVAAVDLLALSKEYQLEFASLKIENKEALREYPNVHYRLIINLHSKDKESVVEQVMLISNMMVKMAHISSEIYGNDFAAGKLIFTIRDEFSISAMLQGGDRCVYVVTSEGEKYTSDLYRVVRELCTNDNRCFVRRDPHEMVNSKQYMNSLLAPNQYWMFGQISESLVPEDLLADLLNDITAKDDQFNPDMMKSIGRFLMRIRESYPIRCLIHEKALYDLALNGEIDIFGHWIQLNYEQRKMLLEYISELTENSKMEIRLIHGNLPGQVDFLSLFSLISSDNYCFLKVFNQNLGEMRMFQVNQNQLELEKMYRFFAQQIWNHDISVIREDKEYIKNYIAQLIINVELLSFSDI